MKKYEKLWMYKVTAAGYFGLAAYEVYLAYTEKNPMPFPYGYVFAFVLAYWGVKELLDMKVHENEDKKQLEINEEQQQKNEEKQQENEEK